VDDRTLVTPGDRPLAAAGDRATVETGERTRAMDAAAGVRCPVCETTNAAGEIWCAECGFRLDAIPGEALDAGVSASPAHLADESGAVFPLGPGLNDIGRADAALLLPDPTVSRRHAQIGVEGGRLWIEDLGSSNGTRVNGVRLDAGQRKDLEGGETLQFGSKTLTLAIDHPDLLATGEAPAVEGAETPPREGDAAGGPSSAAAAPAGGKSPARGAPEEETAGTAGASEEAQTGPRLVLPTGERIALAEGETTVGRRADNAVVLPDAYTSGSHARIIREGDTLFVLDVGSTNGTLLNGERLAPNERAPIKDGDSLVFGRAAATVRRPEADPSGDVGPGEATEDDRPSAMPENGGPPTTPENEGSSEIEPTTAVP